MPIDVSGDEQVLQFAVPGATPEQLAAGPVAACHHLAFAELDPAEGCRAFRTRSAWLRGEETEPSPLESQNH